MAIEIKEVNGHKVGYDTERGSYCKLPKTYQETKIAEPPAKADPEAKAKK